VFLVAIPFFAIKNNCKLKLIVVSFFFLLSFSIFRPLQLVAMKEMKKKSCHEREEVRI